jgi:hypothetical protein
MALQKIVDKSSLEQALAELMKLRALRIRRNGGPKIMAPGDALNQTQRLGCDLRRLRSRITATPVARVAVREEVIATQSDQWGRRFACTQHRRGLGSNGRPLPE